MLLISISVYEADGAAAAAFGCAEDVGAFSKSLAIILPPGPVPWTPDRSIPCSAASLFANGEAITLSPEACLGCDWGAEDEGAWDSWGLGAGGGAGASAGEDGGGGGVGKGSLFSLVSAGSCFFFWGCFFSPPSAGGLKSAKADTLSSSSTVTYRGYNNSVQVWLYQIIFVTETT